MGCYDVDKKKGMDENGVKCDGTDYQYMTLSELKNKLTHEFHQTKKRAYRIFKQSLIKSKPQNFSWEIAEGNSKVRLSVEFV